MNLRQVFSIHYGQQELYNKETLDGGAILIVSSQGVDNGCYGFFGVRPRYKPPFITVPRTGSIGEAFVQMYPCAVDGNCLVLEPKIELLIDYLFYISFAIRTQKWRYRYGRQITPTRLGALDIIRPEDFRVNKAYDKFEKEIYPHKDDSKKIKIRNGATTAVKITDLFNLVRGHFHAIDRLEDGKYPTISRVSVENGLVGFYQKPSKAKIFPAGTLTVSTVTGDAFFQTTPFIATDNVVMLISKKTYKATTLIYIQALLNQVKWRYSYGRQCYKGSFEKTIIDLPVINDGELDEDYMESVITKQPYWSEFKKRILSYDQRPLSKAAG